jgi:hypothetical protein
MGQTGGRNQRSIMRVEKDGKSLFKSRKRRGCMKPLRQIPVYRLMSSQTVLHQPDQVILETALISNRKRKSPGYDLPKASLDHILSLSL